MVSNHRIAQDDTSLKPNTWTNLDTWTDDDVGTEDGSRVDLGRRVDEDVSSVDPLVLAWVGEQGGMLGSQVRQVKTGTGDEVLGLTDIHPETCEVEGVELAICRNRRENLLLNRGGSELQDGESRQREDQLLGKGDSPLYGPGRMG